MSFQEISILLEKYFILLWQDGVIGGIISGFSVAFYQYLATKSTLTIKNKFILTIFLSTILFSCFGYIQNIKQKENPCEKKLISCERSSQIISDNRSKCESTLSFLNSELKTISSENINYSNSIIKISKDNDNLKKYSSELETEKSNLESKITLLTREVEKCNSNEITPEL